MKAFLRHREGHRTSRTGWLRAAVLGANDGIVSTASLVVGVAAAGAAREDILLAGVAGAVAGALSMAAGEYVSVSSQADTERADLALERTELAADEDAEQRELAAIYVRRGLEPALARDRGAAVDGSRCARRSRTGRTWTVRPTRSTAATGRPCLRRDVRGWSTAADPRGHAATTGVDCSGRLRCIADLPRRARCTCHPSRRRVSVARRGTRRVLGCLGHAGDCGRWSAFRHDGRLSQSPAKQSVTQLCFEHCESLPRPPC